MIGMGDWGEGRGGLCHVLLCNFGFGEWEEWEWEWER